jgi:hypothetical protein
MTVLIGAVTRAATVSVTVGFQWKVTYTPPALRNPRIITITDSTRTTTWPAFNNHPSGQIYNIVIPTGDDALILQDTSNPLQYPVRIYGGNNVRVVGLDLSLVVQATAGTYLKKIPNGIACHLIGNRTSFVEGCKIELNGAYADQFVTRNENNISDNGTPARNVIIQNTACQGAQGTWASHPDGDYLHSDFHQNQGLSSEPMHQLIFENISQRTAATGIVVHDGIDEIICRNFNFDRDERLTENLHILNPLWTDSGATSWENIWTDFPISSGMPARIRYGDEGVYYSFQASGGTLFSDEIHQGVPPGGDFAPWDQIGLNYVSPHGLP